MAHELQNMATIQEIRRPKTGGRVFRAYYSGDYEAGYRVSLLVIWKLMKRVIRRKSFSKRIYVFRMRDKFFNYSLINICAPTNDKPDVLKDELYESLDKDSANGETIKKRN